MSRILVALNWCCNFRAVGRERAEECALPNHGLTDPVAVIASVFMRNIVHTSNVCQVLNKFVSGQGMAVTGVRELGAS